MTEVREGRYVPPLHQGTREELVKKLLDEAAGIYSNGWVRNLA